MVATRVPVPVAWPAMAKTCPETGLASSRIARSTVLSTPATVALTVPFSVRTVRLLAPLMTWAAVINRFGPTRKPVPLDLPSHVTAASATPDDTAAKAAVKSV